MSPDCRQSPGVNTIPSNTAGQKGSATHAVAKLDDDSLAAPVIPRQMAATRPEFRSRSHWQTCRCACRRRGKNTAPQPD